MTSDPAERLRVQLEDAVAALREIDLAVELSGVKALAADQAQGIARAALAHLGHQEGGE